MDKPYEIVEDEVALELVGVEDAIQRNRKRLAELEALIDEGVNEARKSLPPGKA